MHKNQIIPSVDVKQNLKGKIRSVGIMLLQWVLFVCGHLTSYGFKINYDMEDDAFGSNSGQFGSDVMLRGLSPSDAELQGQAAPDMGQLDLNVQTPYLLERGFFHLDNTVHKLTDISERATPHTEDMYEDSAESYAEAPDLTDHLRDTAQRSLSQLDLLSERLDSMQQDITELKEGKKLESCNDGWYKYGKSCYYFSRYRINWFDSMLFCMASGGYLAEINDSSENSYLWRRVKFLNAHFVWIGGTDIYQENDFIWMHSQKRITTSIFRNWPATEPNNSNGHEHCMNLRDWDGHWNDSPCYDSFNFICEKEVK